MNSPTTNHQLPTKKGSALLIVLGMFAFMLVSAVSFSVYMRASRAPSSYLLRNASMRQVVKAAVARAIDEVDTAIGNDPFPGVGYNHDYSTSLSEKNQPGDKYSNGNFKRDNWHGRVFTPGGETNMASTVSTLTLEGLGYLPPCLVNEVRYWSRHTRTANWHAFNYGLGRYAFTVVNVSDFFDLNTFITPASGIRRHYLNRSSSPHGRVSPTYLFRGGDHLMNDGGGAASAFLTAIATGSGIGNDPPVAQVPFVSLMDFNLSLLNNPLNGFATPFGRLIKDNNGSTFLSGMEDAARRTVYMAGGWNGGSNLTWNAYQTTGRINLKYPECQPFAERAWVMDGSANLTKCINDVRTPFWLTIEPYIYPLTVALMCDYLDCDSVPVSLCIPSVEAAPMLCGVTLNPDCVKYTVSYVKGEPGPPDNSGKKTRTDTCKIKIDIDQLETELTTVYPFASGSQGQSDNYRVESFARVFFVEDSNLGDGDLEDDGLRNSFFYLGDDFNWSVNNDNSRAAYMQVKIANGTVSTSDYLKSGQGEALEKAAIKGDLGNNVSLSKEAMVAELTVEIDDSGNERVVSANDPGQIDFYKRDLSERVNFKTAFESTTPVATKYRPCVAVWMRIVDANGKTVDMAPAIPAYDNLNGFSENKGDVGIADFNRTTGAAAGAPALRFFAKQADASAGIEPNGQYFKDQDGQEKKTQWKQTAYAVNDPRYNWAPEHWYAQKSGNPKDFWFDNVKAFRDGHDWCDPDIFMSVSDQGYLQSMYEFMMLPQIGSMITKEGMDCGALDLNPAGNYNGKVRLACGDVAHNGLMWRTYRAEAFQKDSGTWDIGYLEQMSFDEADNGLRVNPYTDITNIMFGAFANMPLDWASAGTNFYNNSMSDKNYMKPESSDFKGTDDYIFEWSYKYQDVYAMASFWMGLFGRTKNMDERKKLYRANGWQDVFDDPGIVYWRTGEVREEPPDVDVERVEQILKDEMTSVDRKFFYGYLRGCFANTAQLFLVFVRAETTAGGAVGAGARAVALVWRDPAPPADGPDKFKKADGGSEPAEYGKDNADIYLKPFKHHLPEETWRFNKREYPPHRTRVLFYHQFD